MVGTWRIIEVHSECGKLGGGCEAAESLPFAPRPWENRLSLAFRQGTDGGQRNPQAPKEDGLHSSLPSTVGPGDSEGATSYRRLMSCNESGSVKCFGVHSLAARESDSEGRGCSTARDLPVGHELGLASWQVAGVYLPSA